MGLISHYAILNYGLPKSTQGVSGQNEFFLQHDSGTFCFHLIPKLLLEVLFLPSYNVFLRSLVIIILNKMEVNKDVPFLQISLLHKNLALPICLLMD